jgi:hypothetical protein
MKWLQKDVHQAIITFEWRGLRGNAVAFSFFKAKRAQQVAIVFGVFLIAYTILLALIWPSCP